MLDSEARAKQKELSAGEGTTSRSKQLRSCSGTIIAAASQQIARGLGQSYSAVGGGCICCQLLPRFRQSLTREQGGVYFVAGFACGLFWSVAARLSSRAVMSQWRRLPYSSNFSAAGGAGDTPLAVATCARALEGAQASRAAARAIDETMLKSLLTLISILQDNLLLVEA